jgi:hypothetical protein
LELGVYAKKRKPILQATVLVVVYAVKRWAWFILNPWSKWALGGYFGRAVSGPEDGLRSDPCPGTGLLTHYSPTTHPALTYYSPTTALTCYHCSSITAAHLSEISAEIPPS